MKTPTLIVRLIGLYLIVQNSIAMFQTQKVSAMNRDMGLAQQQIVGDLWTYTIIGLLVGLVATLFAGRLARILTFDAGRE